MIRNLFVLSIVAALTACGGGGGDSSSTPAPQVAAATAGAEGLWKGTTSNGRTISGIVLDDGTYWVLYSHRTNSNFIGGAIQGTGTSTNGSFTSTNPLDFNLEGGGIITASLTATYTQKQVFNGSIAYPAVPNSTVTFTSTYSNDYDSTPSLATIVGTYSGSAAVAGGVESATVTVNASGAVSSVGASGCTATGIVAPRVKGNVYNLSVTFGGAPCSNANSTVTGIGYFDATSKRIYALGLNSARSNGFVFVGTKP